MVVGPGLATASDVEVAEAEAALAGNLIRVRLAAPNPLDATVKRSRAFSLNFTAHGWETVGIAECNALLSLCFAQAVRSAACRLGTPAVAACHTLPRGGRATTFLLARDGAATAVEVRGGNALGKFRRAHTLLHTARQRSAVGILADHADPPLRGTLALVLAARGRGAVKIHCGDTLLTVKSAQARAFTVRVQCALGICSRDTLAVHGRARTLRETHSRRRTICVLGGGALITGETAPAVVGARQRQLALGVTAGCAGPIQQCAGSRGLAGGGSCAV